MVRDFAALIGSPVFEMKICSYCSVVSRKLSWIILVISPWKVCTKAASYRL